MDKRDRLYEQLYIAEAIEKVKFNQAVKANQEWRDAVLEKEEAFKKLGRFLEEDLKGIYK